MTDIPASPLGKKIPRWVIPVVGGSIVGIAYLIYDHEKNKNSTAAAPAASPVVASQIGAAGTPAQSPLSASGPGADTYTSIPSGSSPSGLSAYATNAQWAEAGVQYLVSGGTPGTEASTALSDYLSGTENSDQNATALINQVISDLGPPPQGVVAATPTPTPTPTGTVFTPEIVANTASKNGAVYESDPDGKYTLLSAAEYDAMGRPAPSEYIDVTPQLTEGYALGGTSYTVKSGDTLQSIANAYYGSTADASIIQQANSWLGSNTNLTPGTILIIPPITQNS
jgi:nucleoid-associated protein YgaU